MALITSGTSTMVETSPQWPPASVPCTTRISTPAATWRSACSLAPTRAATGTPCFLPISIIAFGGTPSALAISLIGCLKETSSNSIARCASNGCGWLSATLVVVSSMPYFFKQVFGEGAMLRRNPRLEALPGDVLLARGRDVFRDQHVEPIGLAVDVIVDPFQFLLDRFGRMRGGAEHAETAGAADRGHHVAAMAEGEQGKFDSQHVADRRFHGCAHSLRQLLSCSFLVADGDAPTTLAHQGLESQAGFGFTALASQTSREMPSPIRAFRMAKYAARTMADFGPCALAPRVEC